MIQGVRDVEVAVPGDCYGVRPVERRLRGLHLVAIEAAEAVAGDGDDLAAAPLDTADAVVLRRRRHTDRRWPRSPRPPETRTPIRRRARHHRSGKHDCPRSKRQVEGTRIEPADHALLDVRHEQIAVRRDGQRTCRAERRLRRLVRLDDGRLRCRARHEIPGERGARGDDACEERGGDQALDRLPRRCGAWAEAPRCARRQREPTSVSSRSHSSPAASPPA